MKHLVVGAGATVAEALALGNPREDCPPLISNFSRKTWADYSPSPLLDIYLKELGYWEEVPDLRELFYKLEDSGVTNIERFMEFAWNNRHLKLEMGERLPTGYISGLRISAGGSNATVSERGCAFWENLLYHGVGRPLADLMVTCFFENGTGFRELRTTKRVVQKFEASDLILNLNYDTVFEIALTQLGRSFAYAPNPARPDQVLVCKPHGSLNMVVNEKAFTFGQPEWLGLPQPQGYRSYSGLIPPRLNKSYEQHPIAKMILEPAWGRRPRSIVMWGVGLTESDTDLLALYRHWASTADVVEVINPNSDVAVVAQELLACNVRHFRSVEAWEAHTVK